MKNEYDGIDIYKLSIIIGGLLTVCLAILKINYISNLPVMVVLMPFIISVTWPFIFALFVAIFIAVKNNKDDNDNHFDSF